jgi:hypothetical protein
VIQGFQCDISCIQYAPIKFTPLSLPFLNNFSRFHCSIFIHVYKVTKSHFTEESGAERGN